MTIEIAAIESGILRWQATPGRFAVGEAKACRPPTMRAASYKAASNKILLICVLLSVLGFPLRGIAARVQPSNLPAGFCDDVVNQDFISNTTAQINSDTDCTEVVAQTQGPHLCVVRYRNITLGSCGTLGFSGTRPVALTAQGNVLIQGVVYTGAGPDSITGGVGLAFGGGGGGGGISSGGNGGSGSDTGTVNNGGLGGAAGGTRALRPLQGGRAGGAGGGNDPTPGGTGGGALALVACGSLIVTAQIDAGGRGGSGGIAETNFGAANGGGGGGGGGTRNFGPANYGQPGASGGYTSTPALGGAALDTAGAGGRGAPMQETAFRFPVATARILTAQAVAVAERREEFASTSAGRCLTTHYWHRRSRPSASVVPM